MAVFTSLCRQLIHDKSLFFNVKSLPTLLGGIRNVGYNPKVEHPHEDDYKIEVTRDPEDWKYVERLLPRKTIPEPKVLEVYPSGWRPASDHAKNHPYYVERSKNHMLSVYLRLYSRGQIKVTQVKKIHGDIWLLHKELSAHLEEQVGKRIASYVNEASGMVRFKGDFVYYTEQWLLSKGF